MKTIDLIAPLFLLTLFLTGCSSTSVLSDYDRFADFSDYKTFSFYEPGIARADLSDADKEMMLTAVAQKLAAEGYEQSSDGDMLVSIFTSERDRIDVYNNAGWGWDWGWGWGPWWGGNFTPSSSYAVDGVLYIDIIDCERKQLVWQGMATKDVMNNIDITDQDERMTLLVDQVLGVFPPPNKKKQIAQN